MTKHSQAARATGAAIAATSAFGLFLPTAQAVTTTDEATVRHLKLVPNNLHSQAQTSRTSAVLASSHASTVLTSKKAKVHVVRDGDTLWDLSQKYSTSVSAIAKANRISSSDYLQIGQKIKIPGSHSGSSSSTGHASSSKTSRHVVVSGETLSSIASKHGTTTGAIQTANSLSNPNLIYVGQVLKIGGKGSGKSAQTVGASSTSSSASSSTSSKATRHVVVSGETLSSIAAKHKTTTGAIAKANSLKNPNRVYVGQVLKIGSSSSGSSSSSNSVGNTFLDYTYPESTTKAANANKDKLTGSSTPSKAQMQQIVQQAAANQGVDPSLALAHAQVESGFDQSAVSPANAVGVMQVIPSSGEWASQLVGRNLDLLDPYDNATAGVAIIKYLQSHANSKEEGIAGYYQGLAGVQDNGMYPDTQSYVAKVKAAQRNY